MKIRKYICFAVTAAMMAACSAGHHDKCPATDSDNDATTDDTETTEVVADTAGIVPPIEVTEIEPDDAAGEERDNDAAAEDAAEVASAEIDAVLDDYEATVDKLVSLSKKVKDGDLSAAADLAAYMEKYQHTADRLGRYGSEMSSAQAARMAKIANKALKAAQ